MSGGLGGTTSTAPAAPAPSETGADAAAGGRAFTAEAVQGLPGPEWLRRLRLDAFERVREMPVPTPADELWRYSRIDEVDLGTFVPLPPPGPPSAGGTGGDGAAAASLECLPPEVSSFLGAIGPRSGVAVALDGPVAVVERRRPLETAGVHLGGLLEGGAAVALPGQLANGGGVELAGGSQGSDYFLQLGNAFMADAVVVTVPAGAELEDPIVVVHLLGDAAEGGAVFPRTLVEIGRGARATVVELVVSADVRALVCPAVRLAVADEAQLAYQSVQQLGGRVVGLGYQTSTIGAGGELLSFGAALGGSYARSRVDSRLEGEGGRSRLLAAYLGDGGQMHDIRTLQEHAAARTTSELLFKGAVAGTAHSVYSGLIRIHHGARGSNAFQTNRNLVLSEGAHADSVPNLDIEENDVRCSHASTVGPIDADQRYYLESRGVPGEAAERLIVAGFFGDLLARIPTAGLREHLGWAIAARIGGGAP